MSRTCRAFHFRTSWVRALLHSFPTEQTELGFCLCHHLCLAFPRLPPCPLRRLAGGVRPRATARAGGRYDCISLPSPPPCPFSSLPPSD